MATVIETASAPSVPWLALLRVHLTYLWRHQRFARLGAPRLMTEYVQTRKLSDRDPRLPLFADKLRVKRIVASRLGEEWVVPTLWHGTVLPEIPLWPYPFVVKSRHGCGHVVVVRDAADYRAARRRSERWMRSTYGRWLDEWLYGEIERGLLVEPYLGTGTTLPVDYKCFAFSGRVELVQVHLDRATRHRWIVFDREWVRQSVATDDPDPPPPGSLPRMIEAAAVMAADFPYARVDFYEVEGRPLFGEVTFYPGSGLDPVRPIDLDRRMGAWCAAALALAATGLID